jgi:hypothetical protein
VPAALAARLDPGGDRLSGESAVGLRPRPGSGASGSSTAGAFIAVLDDRRGHLAVLVADPVFDDVAAFRALADSLRFP